MNHRKQIVRKTVNIILTLVLVVCMLPIMNITAKADGNTFSLGAFNYSTGKFEYAAGSGSALYTKLSITYGYAPNTGETLTLPTDEGFVIDSNNSTNVSTIITITSGKSPSDIATYVKEIVFNNSGSHLRQTITVELSNNNDSDKITDTATISDIKIQESAHGTLIAVNNAGTVTLTATPDDHYMIDDIAFLSSGTSEAITMTGEKGPAVTGSTTSYTNLLTDDNTWIDSYLLSSSGSSASESNAPDAFYAIFKADKKCILKEYKLTTGADSNKNWKAWTLSGGNFTSTPTKDSSGWAEIDNEEISSTQQTSASTTYTYPISNNSKAYDYYMFVIDSSQGFTDTSTSDTIEMKKAEFSGMKVADAAPAITPAVVAGTNTYSFSMPANSVTVAANFIEKYKVSYDPNDASGTVPETTYHLPNESITVAEKGNLTKTGYGFGGWSTGEYEGTGTDKHLKIYQPGSTLTVNKNINFYAVWEENPFNGVSVSGYEGVYDGTGHSITVTPPENSGITVEYRKSQNGTYSSTNPSYSDAGKHTVYYKLTKGSETETGSQTVEISKRPLTISVDNLSKIYGSAEPAIGSNDYTLLSGSLISGDVIESITLDREDGNNAGEYAYKTEGATTVIKKGETDVSANYEITYYVGSLTINKKEVTVSGITADNKTYNGTTDAALNFSGAYSWRVGSDDVTVTAIGTFSDKNVGNNKVVTISNIALSGNAKDNYSLVGTQQKECNANITSKSVTINGITANNKAYDGNTTATLNYSGAYTWKEGKDDVKVTATGTFEDAELGKNKKVTISDIALSGDDKNNYVLAASGHQNECSASIGGAEVTISGITADNKIYDGNNKATLNYKNVKIEGLNTGDEVTVTATGTFVDSKVGNKKVVAITDITLSGKDADSYVLTKTQQTGTTANITKKQVTLSDNSISVSDKEYDGTTTATLDNTKLAINGVIAGDELKIATAAAAFADNKVGENKNVSISGITLSGADVANYEIESGYNPTTTASITAKPVTVTGITASDKIYDGNTTASLDSTNAVINGIVKGDNLTFTITGGTFADKKVGKDKTVTISGLTLSGTSAANYVLSADQSYTTSADINARPVVVSGITAKDKSYDGDESVEFKYDNMTITGVVEGDKLTAEAEGSFTDKERGNDKTVVITKITLAGEDSANYVIDSDNRQIECKAAIKGIPIVVSGIQAKSKTYDGKTNAELDFSGVVLSGKKDADKVTISAIGDFEDKNAGENKKVNLKSVQLTGADSDNYELAEEGQQESCKADIKPISVNVSGIAAENKVYDGNDEVTFKYDNVVVDGKLKSDKVDVKAVGAFVDKYPGTDKEVVISDISLEGTDGGNYVLAENGMQKKTVADITIANDKVNDDIKNEDGSTTHKEVEYKDGEPTGKVKEVTYDDNGVSLIEKTTYDESGEIVEKSVAISFDDDGEISQVIVKDAEGNELVATGETEITYGSKDETVGEIVANLKAEGIEGNEKGSVLDSKDITPDEMAYLLNDESTTMELLNEAVNTNDVSVKGGANVDATGFGAGILTDKAEILKNVLTPTELVRMLSSADTTNVVVEFKEEAVKNKAVINAKKKIDTLIGSEEDVYYFGCDMYKSVAGDADKTNISEFGTPIKLGLIIPETLRKQGRSFRLLSSHEDSVTGELTAYVLPLEVDENYNASFTADKLCLMALTYTDDDIKARKISEQEAVKKAEEEKQAAAQKEAADKKAAEEKEAADKKAAEEKEAADKKAAEEKAAAEKTEAEKKMAEQMKAAEEKEAVANAIAEIYSKLATAKKDIDSNTALDDTAKYEAKKTLDAAAASAKNSLENKGSSAKKSAVESFNNSFNKAITEGKNATDIRVRSTVTAEEMDKNSISINSGLKVDQKASVINVSWGKVDGAENYDVYVQYCGSTFLETPDATLSSDVTSAEISMVGGKKLNLKKNYKIYVNAYRTVEGKKIVLAKTITAHVVGRKNAVYTNAKGIKIKSAKTLDLDVNGVSIIKAKTNRVAKKKKLLTDSHAKEFRYASSDKKVATVSKSGVIKAVGSGTCTIYVYARNGYAKKIKVTVK